jgi:predicted CopG family antitoxin
MTRGKRKQGPKPGKVVRVPPDVWSVLNAECNENESISAMLRRLIPIVKKRTLYVLPGATFKSAAEARGAAVMQAAKSGKKTIPLNEIEPIPVREIS